MNKIITEISYFLVYCEKKTICFFVLKLYLYSKVNKFNSICNQKIKKINSIRKCMPIKDLLMIAGKKLRFKKS